MISDRYEQVERLELAGRNLEERRLDSNVLCARCTRGTVFRRKGKLIVTVYCHAMNREVPPDIVECSEFKDVKAMDMDTMQRLALPVDPREGINKKSYL